MLTMLRNAVFIWPMVSCEVICAVPLQLAPAMFWLEAHILRASSSTVWACTSKRPAMERISCGSVIKREGISFSYLEVNRPSEPNDLRPCRCDHGLVHKPTVQ